MHGHSTSGRPRAAVILAGRIVDVDPLRWMCVIRTEGGGENSRTYRDVPLGGLYLHPIAGEGIYAMPEIGALVQICKPSEGDSPPFIVAYRPYPSRDVATSSDTNKPSAVGNRPRLSPGDMAMVGRDRNGVFVRRGQFTEILGGPLARTLYQGRTGTIHTICQHRKVDTFGGSLRWIVERPEKDPDGHQRARFDLKLKEFADDRAYVARLQAGAGLTATIEGEPDGALGVSGGAPSSTELVREPVIRLRIFENGDVEESDLAAVLSLAADKDGQLELATTGKIQIEVRGQKNCTVSVSPSGEVEVTADTSVKSTVGTLSVLHNGTELKVGLGTAKVLYDIGFSTMLAAALAEAAASATTLGQPTVSLAALQSALLSGTFTSKRLSTE